MPRGNARSKNQSVPGWGEKSSPPSFLAHGKGRGPSTGWWAGLTGRGRWLAVAGVAALVVMTALLSFFGGRLVGTRERQAPHNAARKPVRRNVTSQVRLSESIAGVKLFFLASGLQQTARSARATSADLVRDLRQAYPAGQAAGALAYLEVHGVLADGPEDQPPGPAESSGARIASRYLATYRAYLARVEAIRAMLRSTPVRGHRREIDLLLDACDGLARELSVVIAGLERLQSPSPEDAGAVAGIEGAADRIDGMEQRVQSALQELGR